MRLRRAAAAALVLAASAAVAAERRSDYGARFLEIFGKAEPTDAVDTLLLEEAVQVFDRVLAVAGKKPGRYPHLLIVNERRQAPRGRRPVVPALEAQALPDGTVVINLPLLRWCFGTDPAQLERGRARLAFVLGHEMAHLYFHDSWHAEAFATAEGYGDPQLRKETRLWAAESRRERQVKELRADEAGFLYMTMAGLPPSAVLSGEENFLRDWVAQIAEGKPPVAGHPTFVKRSKMLQATLSRLAAALGFFRFGARLVQVGRPDDALPLLRHFFPRFPSREVENALGVAHYQRALSRLRECGSDEGLRFKLPVAVDLDTLAARIRPRGPGEPECLLSRAVQEELAASEQALRSAVSSDSAYQPARLNLAALLLVPRRNALEALAVLRQGRAGAPDAGHPVPMRVALIEAVALYDSARDLNLDAAGSAIQALEELARCSAPEPCEAEDVRRAAVFNRARILQERGRAEAAQGAWRDFLELERVGAFADEARFALLRAGLNEPGGPPTPKPGRALLDRLSKDKQRTLSKATREPFNLGDMRGAFLFAPPLEALELRGVIEVVVETLAEPRPVESVRRELGPPVAVDEYSTGRTLVYEDVAFDVENERVVRQVLFQRR